MHSNPEAWLSRQLRFPPAPGSREEKVSCSKNSLCLNLSVSPWQEPLLEPRPQLSVRAVPWGGFPAARMFRGEARGPRESRWF